MDPRTPLSMASQPTSPEHSPARTQEHSAARTQEHSTARNPEDVRRYTLHIVVIGVSGSGKTALARTIAEREGWALQEADELHDSDAASDCDRETPGSGVEPRNASAAGGEGDRTTPTAIPTKEERRDTMRRVRQWIVDKAGSGEDSVTACTALQRSHREIINEAEDLAPGAKVFYVHLYGTEEVVRARMGQRIGARIPEEVARRLFDEQITELERLEPEETGVQLDVSRSLDELLEATLSAANFARHAYGE